MTLDHPPPDHPDANSRGCCCRRDFNKLGEGDVVDGVRIFTINSQCTLHADPQWWMTQRRPSSV